MTTEKRVRAYLDIVAKVRPTFKSVSARVCLVTSGNIASDPRLVKEASALRESGYSVRLIATNIISSLASYDAKIIAQLQCDWSRLEYRKPAWKRVARRVRQRAAATIAKRRSKFSLELAVLGHHSITPALTTEARRLPADLYIAHNLAALPAAAAAASRHGAPLGFDAEDYHPGELEDELGQVELCIRRVMERELLPRCRHLTCASPMIGEAYARDYGVSMKAILNVFSLEEAPPAPVRTASTRGQEQSLYWFSQTIGPNRGLEQIVQAMAVMSTRVRLRLRGNPIREFVERLRRLAEQADSAELSSRIEVLPIAEPWEMVRLAAPHDLGLATELTISENRSICLTNKIFTYLLAGVPVALSQTPAQTQMAGELGEAALLIDLHNPEAIAASFDSFFSSAERQQAARDTAWRLARERYNWDIEQHKFLRLVEEVTLSR